MEKRHGSYLVSDDASLLDAAAIHAYLSRSYWSEGIPIKTVQHAINNSLCIGVYTPEKIQVGLVRVITDYATYAYLCDVYVLEEHRKKGLAKAMLAFAIEHPKLQGLRSWNLRTRDAHTLYEELGFKVVDNPESYMILRFSDVYQKSAAGN